MKDIHRTSARRSAVAALLCIALLLCVTAWAKAAADLPAKRAKAEALFREQKYAEAIELLQEVLKEAPLDSPECLRALRSLRRACERTGTHGTLVQAAEGLLGRLEAADLEQEKRHGLHLRLLYSLADAYELAGRTADATARYEQIIKLAGPNEARMAESKLIERYQQAGHGEKALAILKRRLAANPRDQHARAQAALLCFGLGKVAEGRAIVGIPKEPAQIRYLAQQLFDAKCLPQAEELTRKILGKDPRATFLLAKINYEQKKFEDAAQLFTQCLEEAPEKKFHRIVDIARKLAEVRAHLGALRPAIKRTRQGIEALQESETGRRCKLLMLLCELQKANGNPTGAFETYLECCEFLPARQRQDRRLAELGRDAIRHLLALGWPDKAEELLQRAGERDITGTWIDCAQYVLFITRNQQQDAADLIDGLESEAGKDERKLFTLTEELAKWGLTETRVRFCRRIIEVKPDNSVYDANAHVRLGQYHYGRQQFAQAVRHFKALDAIVGGAGSMGIIGEQSFRRLEVHARYRAAGDDTGELIKLLSDRNPLRRIAAAQLLGEHGSAEHIPQLNKRAASAGREFRTALKEAAARIQMRHAKPPPKPGPVSEEQLRKKLAKVGKLLWMEKDPFNQKRRWAAVEKNFVLSADLQTGGVTDFAEAMKVFGGQALSASAIAFTQCCVWVGTDHGLFMFERNMRRWSGYAINRRHVDVPVKDVRVQDKKILITVELPGGAITYRFDPATGEWKTAQ